MNLIVKENSQQVIADVAQRLIKNINAGNIHNIALPTGRTPLGLYQCLVEAYKNNEVSFEKCHFFNLDEYVGYAPKNKHSYHYFLHQNFIQQIDVRKNHVHFWNGLLDGNHEQCLQKEQLILDLGGIDVALLGLGLNGHIAFNEPGSTFESISRVVSLTQSTIKANEELLDPMLPYPKQAVSMGLSTLYQAKKIMMLALGKAKANIVSDFYGNKKTAEILPAVHLFEHKDFSLFLDQDAASKLEHINY